MLVTPAKTYQNHAFQALVKKKHPNLMNQVTPPPRRQYFVSDITYIKKQAAHPLSIAGYRCLQTVRIMGYHLSDDLSAESVVNALKMAVRHRPSNHSVIHHSDRGYNIVQDLSAGATRSHQDTSLYDRWL